MNLKNCKCVVLDHDENSGFTILGNLNINSTRFLHLDDKISPIFEPLNDSEFKLFRIFNEMQDKLGKLKMKVLSMPQPWAWLVFNDSKSGLGLKDCENKVTCEYISYRGDLGICTFSKKHFDHKGYEKID